ncbi:hypothetical protein KI659_17050 [Litoribacter alkaliphilus]|uniref:Cellulase Ig-like domain-containing protein n=1 Tax=Litoribacter ruber TaxID=702568 RepID=A0AAP2CKS1_9BACT|nr:hypothetical protein [Litoribacter alkaliphilus]MBS9525730.1 hypothetical protein [Litoribacter alkaliphilus]
MKNIWMTLAMVFWAAVSVAQELEQLVKENHSFTLYLKKPGNPAVAHPLSLHENGTTFQAQEKLPLSVSMELQERNGEFVIKFNLKAEEEVYFNFHGELGLEGLSFESAQMLLPGFWYRKNQRSPERAPSVKTSNDWLVREDRLSTPMTALYDQEAKKGFSLIRMDVPTDIALATHQSGEVILSGLTNLGSLGFGEKNDIPFLSFAFPYAEAPHSYYRKLTLGDPVQSFLRLDGGESISFRYLLFTSQNEDFSDFVAHNWTMGYDKMQPTPLDEQQFTDHEIKSTLTEFFKSSYMETQGLKGFSGVHLETATCEVVEIYEVGFIGRILLNAFNALEFGEAHGDEELVRMARNIMDSYAANGFTQNGLIREMVDFRGEGNEPAVYSIRRQSEGIYALLHYFNYEKAMGRNHPEYEKKIQNLLDTLLSVQQADGSFPRKFDEDLQVIDETGGSSPSAVAPLVMAYHYFGDKKYLAAAKKVGEYQEREIISKSDYFSSTLDADCEDKEAALYASTAMYYLALVSKGKERKHYVSLAEKAAYFTLSWYYTWDVPFAQGQMLGDIGFKSRGWGNVSVENNHIDVFIFEFAEVLRWLSSETGEERFRTFGEVIRSSMREQLLPTPGNMMGIAKVGYYPEVVQHTAWDYGKNGKGYYNDLFAPGWTVASLWELLSDDRTAKFFQTKK